MSTEIECAQLANRVYSRTDENRTPVPTGWDELLWLKDAAFSGFSAGVYRRGNEIVISYTGTNEAKAADFLLANIPIGLGATSVQVEEAMRLYFQVKATNPGAAISFTGHSLGGGLASMMAVFFNKPAVIFDPAPFELGARNPISLAAYLAWTVRNGYSDAAFTSYATSLDTADFAVREGNVKSIATENEILALVRAINPTIYGGVEQVEQVGAQTLITGGGLTETAARIELHSMTLLASLLASSAFKDAIQNNAESLSVIFDSNLYRTNPELSDRANFLDKLYISHANGVPLLDRFAADLQRIGKTGVAHGLQKSLTVVAVEYYYFRDAASTTALFTTNANGIHFKYSDIGASSYKSLTLLAQAVHPYLSTVENQLVGTAQLRQQDAWHIQSGTDGLNWTATDSSADVAIGGAGVDIIDAGAGNIVQCGWTSGPGR